VVDLNLIVGSTEKTQKAIRRPATKSKTTTTGPSNLIRTIQTRGKDFFISLKRIQTLIQHSQVNYCLDPNPSCDDPLAFHMTKKTEKLDKPYNSDTSNHYAQAKDKPDILMCKVLVEHPGSNTKATVYTGAKLDHQKGDKTGDVGKGLVVSGLPADLTINKGDDDDKNPVTFSYAPKDDKFAHFEWATNTKGSSKQTKDDGSYCEIKGKKGSDDRKIGCVFPCLAAK